MKEVIYIANSTAIFWLIVCAGCLGGIFISGVVLVWDNWRTNYWERRFWRWRNQNEVPNDFK